MTTTQLRDSYLNFFKDRGHAIIPSASLLPENDPTTLFTGSGMQPMVPYLLGQKHPLGTRITDSQKSYRSGDIDEVGDNRHTTFFEMLGNWSLGDYFKEEQLPWMFEFLTQKAGIDPNRLYVSVFIGDPTNNIPKDTDSAEIWKGLFASKGIEAQSVEIGSEENGYNVGMQGGRIFYYDVKKNWWSRAGVPDKMPVGEPGGPDSEMFYEFTEVEHNPKFGVHCHPNCDCGRFLEIGNNVFMEYKKNEDGTFSKLPQKNVDFGGGLERVAAAVFNTPDVFKIDLFDEIRTAIEQASGKTYGALEKETYAFRVLLDHIRASVFLMCDGALPSNKDQGYFTRRMIRRAVRFGRDLGIHQNFVRSVASAVIRTYEGQYPELRAQSEVIETEIEKEEIKFRRTLEDGIKQFDNVIQKPGVQEKKQIDGVDAFDLLQSYGFPIELTEELAKERGLTIDMDVFAVEKKKHQDLSRSASEQKFKGGLADHSDMSLKYHTATHLLHAALHKVLGEEATQKGSNITPERLRFDFAYPDKMTPEQIAEVEALVNAAITRDYPMTWQEMPYERAKELRAIGLFGDKYGDMVKVYTVGDPEVVAQPDPTSPTFSRELCGGPHVEHTGVLGKFKIVKEEACSAGVRRIKAVLE